MRKILCLSFLVIAIHTLPQAQVQKRKYEITGKLSGVADNTVLYLQDASGTQVNMLDSTRVMNAEFKFMGYSDREAISRLIIRTKTQGEYRYFWIEQSPTIINASDGKLPDAVITGSPTQVEYDQYREAVKAKDRIGSMDASKTYIRARPNSLISTHVLSVYASSYSRDTTESLYNILSEEMKKTAYAKRILEYLTLNKNIKIGSRYANFSAQDTMGKMVSLSDFNGKLTLLDFWGSWCGPCRQEHPDMIAIYNEYKKAGFEIVGVASEVKKEEWVKAIAKDGLPWPNISELKGDKTPVTMMYGLSYYPTNFLIDKNGIVIAKDLHGDDLRKKLAELLK